jgi:hypothetical protein
MVGYARAGASVLTGVLLTLIRLQEPFFMFQVKKRFYAFFGKEIKDQKEYQSDIYKNTLNHYLTKALNLELVNVILASIAIFTREAVKQERRTEKIIKRVGEKNSAKLPLAAENKD